MAKVPLEMMDFKRFVRLGEEFFYGSNHVQIVRAMGWAESVEEIKERLRREGGLDLDMGLIQRRELFVGVGQNSETFKYPGSLIFETVRDRTMKILPQVYGEEELFRKL